MSNNELGHRSLWVAYVGPFGFPDGGAAARRVLGNAQSLVEVGYRVVVASGQAGAATKDVEYRKGINIVSLCERTAEHWPRPLRRFRYAAMGRRTCDWLESQKQVPSAVILYSGYTPYLLRLIPWCHRNGIPLLFDAVEWYEASGIFGSLASPYQWNIELAMRWLVKKTDGVIAISSYLTRYYRQAGRPVLTIPPTLSIKEIPEYRQSFADTRLQLCYAGMPTANKDLIDVVIAAVLDIDPCGNRLKLHVAGPSERELLKLPSLSGRFSNLPPCIQSHGRLPQCEAMTLVQRCDFTILLRRDHRVSKAGFSTKFVESLAMGTPVIGNLTGDLETFLIDQETGLVCEDWSPAQLRKTILRALATSPMVLQNMRRHCKEMVAAHFDCHVHSQALGSFIRAVSRQ